MLLTLALAALPNAPAMPILVPATQRPPIQGPTTESPATESPAIEELWSVPLGEGFSSVASTDGRAIATYRVSGSGETSLVAVDETSGEVLWRAAFPDVAREGQDDYGGGRGPHATPLVHEGAVFALGFGGRLAAFDADTGAPRWSIDLVDDLGAKPVQFGFGASPVAFEELVLVVSGGEAGVTAFDAETGDVAWRSPAFAASYVTPVRTTIDGAEHLVCVFEDETVGLDPADGAVLWSLPHVRRGLTNYAMIVPLGGGSFVVSGQGNVGARRIDVEREGEGWAASARWHARAAKFSHGRVAVLDGLVVGSNASMLCAVDAESGSLAYKLRGFGESNVVDAGPVTLRVDEEGEVSALRLTPAAVEVVARRKALEGKAWAAPTLTAAGVVLLRDARRLVALRIPAAAASAAAIETTETGYRAGEVTVAPALLAFAQGTYGADDGTALDVVATVDGALSVRSDAADSPIRVKPVSDSVFEGVDGERLELITDDSAVPIAVRWAAGAGEVVAQRRPLEPVELDDASRARIVGAWRVADAVDLEIEATDEGLRASSDMYDGVRFAVEAEAPDRLWMEALDAPYGIPTLLIEVSDGGITVHQESNTVRGVRR